MHLYTQNYAHLECMVIVDNIVDLYIIKNNSEQNKLMLRIE